MKIKLLLLALAPLATLSFTLALHAAPTDSIVWIASWAAPSNAHMVTYAPYGGANYTVGEIQLTPNGAWTPYSGTCTFDLPGPGLTLQQEYARREIATRPNTGVIINRPVEYSKGDALKVDKARVKGLKTKEVFSGKR